MWKEWSDLFYTPVKSPMKLCLLKPVGLFPGLNRGVTAGT